jgi:hypothetical protein
VSAFEIPWHPPARTLRQFAGLWLLAIGVAAWRLDALAGPAGPLAAVGLALAIGVAGLIRPSTIRPLFVGLMVATAPIGWVVAHLALTVAYFGLFTPVALVFRLRGRDALERRFDPACDTYWQPKPVPADPAGYFRTF